MYVREHAGLSMPSLTLWLIGWDKSRIKRHLLECFLGIAPKLLVLTKGVDGRMEGTKQATFFYFTIEINGDYIRVLHGRGMVGFRGDASVRSVLESNAKSLLYARNDVL